jgi:ribosomal protein L40E
MIAVVSNEVTCRKCGARNRLKGRGAPPGGLRPVCGRCGAPLGDDEPSVLNYESAAAGRPKDRRAENLRAIVLIVVVAAALTGLSELLLIMLR